MIRHRGRRLKGGQVTSVEVDWWRGSFQVKGFSLPRTIESSNRSCRERKEGRVGEKGKCECRLFGAGDTPEFGIRVGKEPGIPTHQDQAIRNTPTTFIGNHLGKFFISLPNNLTSTSRSSYSLPYDSSGFPIGDFSYRTLLVASYRSTFSSTETRSL